MLFISFIASFVMTYTVSEGLASNTVLDICEDRSGVLWIATDKGLSRFDGHSFHNYDLSGNCMTAVCEDICGRLWAGTEDGLFVIDKDAWLPASEEAGGLYQSGNTFLPCVVHPLEGCGNVRALRADRSGYVWAYTADDMVYKINVSDGSHQTAFYRTASMEGDYHYCHIIEDLEGDVWIGGRATSVAKVRGGDPELISYPIRNHDTEHFEGSAFLCDSSGHVYATDDKGLFSIYDREDDVFKTLVHIPSGAACAVSDRFGRIWVGGRNGLILLSDIGKDCKMEKISSDNVLCLYADSSGGILAGTDTGLKVYDMRRNAVESYDTRNVLSSDYVTALMQDMDGTLWIGTEKDGTDTLNLDTGASGNLRYSILSGSIPASTAAREREVLRQYSVHKFTGDVNENRVSSLYQDSRGTVYIGLWSHVGFNTFDKKSGQFKRHCLWSVPAGYAFPLLFEGNLFGANWYRGFLEDGHGNMWCATWEGVGLNLFDRKTGEFSGRHFIPGIVPRLPRATISSYSADDGRIYMAGGRWYGYYDIAQKEFHRYVEAFPDDYPNAEIIKRYYSFSPAEQIAMPVNLIDLNLIDRNGNWLALAAANSLFCHNVATGEVNVLFTPDKCITGYSVSKDPEGGVHVLWDNQAVKMVHDDVCGFKVIPEPAGSAVNCIRLSFDSYESGDSVYHATPDGIKITEKSSGKTLGEYLQGIDVTSLTGVGRDSIFAFTPSGAFFVNIKDGSSENISVNAPGTLPSRLASCIALSSDGYLWYGTTDSGLCRIDTASGDIVCFRDLPDNDIRDIFESTDGTLWVATGKGLCRCQEGRFLPVASSGGLSLRRVVEDGCARLWVSSDDGLHCIDNEGRWLTFHACDGLSADCWSSAAVRLSDGRVAFGSRNGMDIIDPSGFLSSFPAPRVIFSFFKTESGMFHSVPDHVSLKHRDNSFSVDFSVPHYEGHRCRYRMEGLDSDWTMTESSHAVIRYAHVPKGKFICKVEVELPDGSWSGDGLDLEVAPAFWQRWWFILLCLLLFCSMVVLVVRLREAVLRRENGRLAAMVDRRTHELRLQIESKNKFFSIVSHDLKNPLHAMSMLSEGIAAGHDKMTASQLGRQIKLLRDSSKGAEKMLNDILSWALTHSDIMVPDLREVNLYDSVDIIMRQYGAVSERKCVALVNSVDRDTVVKADPDMLSVVLRNLVDNAVKYSSVGGRVTVESCLNGNMVQTIVSDEGTGIAEDVMRSLFRIDSKVCTSGPDGERGCGFGLIAVAEFVRKMGGEISVHSTPGEGSRFFFTLLAADETPVHYRPDA